MACLHCGVCVHSISYDTLILFQRCLKLHDHYPWYHWSVTSHMGPLAQPSLPTHMGISQPWPPPGHDQNCSLGDPPGPVQTCSQCSPDICWQFASWHPTEMPSCFKDVFSLCDHHHLAMKFQEGNKSISSHICQSIYRGSPCDSYPWCHWLVTGHMGPNPTPPLTCSLGNPEPDRTLPTWDRTPSLRLFTK